MMATVASAWIEHQRSLAVSLVSAGMGMAPLTISPFASWLITTYDWRTAMLVIGIVASVLLFRPRSWCAGRRDRRSRPARAARRRLRSSGAAAQALRSPQFITLALAHFCCCAAHSGPIFHMVSYAMVCGIAPMTAVTVYSVDGLAGLGGRVLLGVLADRFGAKPVLVGGLMVQALCVATYLAVGQLGEFYALAVVFGLAYGGGDAAVRRAGAGVFRRCASWARCSARFRRVARASAWRWAHAPAAGCSTPSTAISGSISARSASGSPPSRWRSNFPSVRRPTQPTLHLGPATA